MHCDSVLYQIMHQRKKPEKKIKKFLIYYLGTKLHKTHRYIFVQKYMKHF